MVYKSAPPIDTVYKFSVIKLYITQQVLINIRVWIQGQTGKINLIIPLAMQNLMSMCKYFINSFTLTDVLANIDKNRLLLVMLCLFYVANNIFLSMWNRNIVHCIITADRTGWKRATNSSCIDFWRYTFYKLHIKKTVGF